MGVGVRGVTKELPRRSVVVGSDDDAGGAGTPENAITTNAGAVITTNAGEPITTNG